MATPLIEFRNVTKGFDGALVLQGVNATFYEGEIAAIIGKSGAGKSVFLKHIIGLLQPDEGDILFRGEPVAAMSRRAWDAHRSRMSYMFQNNALFDSLTVFDNIALPLRETTHLDAAEIDKRVATRMEQLDLADAGAKYPGDLSGGMQKRAALARALVTDPQVVLFDEPTTGQDPIRKKAILNMIAEYQKAFGFTALLISHDIPDIFRIANRVLVLDARTIVFQGTPAELEQADSEVINALTQDTGEDA